jgi:hypothetical protein
VKLVVLEGPAARQAFDVRNDRTLIGRAPECDVLVFDAQVSRYHAQILRQGHAYFLENLQPANPTIVNDRVMQTRRRLVDGDLIVMGTVVLEVDIPPATVSEDQRRAAEAITDRAELDAPSLVPQASATAAQPTAERLTPRIPTLPPLSPREQLRSVAGSIQQPADGRAARVGNRCRHRNGARAPGRRRRAVTPCRSAQRAPGEPDGYTLALPPWGRSDRAGELVAPRPALNRGGGPPGGRARRPPRRLTCAACPPVSFEFVQLAKRPAGHSGPGRRSGRQTRSCWRGPSAPAARADGSARSPDHTPGLASRS